MTCESCKTAGRTSAHAQSELMDGLCVECWKQRAEAAEKSAEEMRDIIRDFKVASAYVARMSPAGPRAFEKPLKAADHLTGGSNYLSPEQVKEQVRPLVEALRDISNRCQITCCTFEDQSDMNTVCAIKALQHAKAKGWV